MYQTQTGVTALVDSFIIESFAMDLRSRFRHGSMTTARHHRSNVPRRINSHATSTSDPTCIIEVAGPMAGSVSLTAPSGDILRRTLIDQKQELYQGLWAKTMNCGGAGSCGTCIVEVGAESSYLAALPRLDCDPESEILTAEFLAKHVLDDRVGQWAHIITAGLKQALSVPSMQVKEDDSGLMSPRTAAEEKKLKGKPASWRLACQTVVGDGESGGKCRVTLGPK